MTTKTQAQRTKESDERRGVRTKGYKLKLETIAAIAAVAKERGIPQNQLIEDMLECYLKHHQ